MSTTGDVRFYSVEEAAERMGISSKEVRRLVREDKIAYFRIGRKRSRIRIPSFALEDYARREILIQTNEREKIKKF